MPDAPSRDPGPPVDPWEVFDAQLARMLDRNLDPSMQFLAAYYRAARAQVAQQHAQELQEREQYWSEKFERLVDEKRNAEAALAQRTQEIVRLRQLANENATAAVLVAEEWQRAINPCAEHTPDRWEGDGSCVICEGHELKASLEESRSTLTALAEHHAATELAWDKDKAELTTLQAAMPGYEAVRAGIAYQTLRAWEAKYEALQAAQAESDREYRAMKLSLLDLQAASTALQAQLRERLETAVIFLEQNPWMNDMHAYYQGVRDTAEKLLTPAPASPEGQA